MGHNSRHGLLKVDPGYFLPASPRQRVHYPRLLTLRGCSHGREGGKGCQGGERIMGNLHVGEKENAPALALSFFLRRAGTGLAPAARGRALRGSAP